MGDLRSLLVINKIILHCSANSNPNLTANDVRRDHIDNRGFTDIGYHFFIRTSGLVEKGRPIEEVGAHTFGHNWDSIGICLNGLNLPDFTDAQFSSLKDLLKQLRPQIPATEVYPHHFFNPGKLCPVYSVTPFSEYWRSL